MKESMPEKDFGRLWTTFWTHCNCLPMFAQAVPGYMDVAVVLLSDPKCHEMPKGPKACPQKGPAGAVTEASMRFCESAAFEASEIVQACRPVGLECVECEWNWTGLEQKTVHSLYILCIDHGLRSAVVD